MERTIWEDRREVPVLAEVDVLVLGAGPAGVSAAGACGASPRWEQPPMARHRAAIKRQERIFRIKISDSFLSRMAADCI